MTVKEIKQRFFALRNGIVADSLKKGGLPHKIIFGLILPQLSEIAKDVGKDSELATLLWQDRDVRESRLLACKLFDATQIAEEDALKMANDVRSREEADLLCFWLLRHTPYAATLLDRMREIASTNEAKYCAEAMARNITE